MVVVFSLAHYFTVAPEQRVGPVILLFPLALIFFFKLRLYDEIKDYEHDKIHNPTRPLARGLIPLSEVKWLIAVIILLELIFSANAGFSTLFVMFIAIVYSLLMYNEFFIGDLIRPHLTTYAIIHTVVTVPLSLTLVSLVTRQGLGEMSKEVFLFSLSHWFIFNVFEFARKTWATSEEKKDVDSYSKIFGKRGAIHLVVMNSFLGVFCLAFAIDKTILVLVALTLAIGLGWYGYDYARHDSENKAKLYRNMAGVYILLHYIVLSLGKIKG